MEINSITEIEKFKALQTLYVSLGTTWKGVEISEENALDPYFLIYRLLEDSLIYHLMYDESIRAMFEIGKGINPDKEEQVYNELIEAVLESKKKFYGVVTSYGPEDPV